ncbi:MAG: hypothetical protein M3P01_12450 [Actinomycetota bacterium]|nr:hypothetical protein [Actinomycetota bacterium]
MATIKATCPLCGEVDLTASDVALRLGASYPRNTYCFSCPDCGDFIEKAADDRVIRLLLSGGVMPTLVKIPAEALEPHEGPAISHDDLLTFHEMLKSDQWLFELTDHPAAS